MLKSVIVDDEFESRESLKKMLLTYFSHVEVNAVCQNAQEAKEAIELIKPDLLFLDVRLKYETGFDLLSSLNDITFDVIFTANYSEFAFDAVKFSALDYLRKPVQIDDLREAIARAEKKQWQNAQFGQLLKNLRLTRQENARIAVPTARGLNFVRVYDILYFKASGNYTELFFTNGEKTLICRQLKEYEQLLSNFNFFRIHHSYLVHLEYIQSYIRGEGGYIVMNDNTRLEISRRKKEGFLERMGYKA